MDRTTPTPIPLTPPRNTGGPYVEDLELPLPHRRKVNVLIGNPSAMRVTSVGAVNLLVRAALDTDAADYAVAACAALRVLSSPSWCGALSPASWALLVECARQVNDVELRVNVRDGAYQRLRHWLGVAL